jgi:hypothetical protein
MKSIFLANLQIDFVLPLETKLATLCGAAPPLKGAVNNVP